MYCSHCGIKNEDDAAICPHCYTKQKPIKQNDTGALGYGLLSILVPIAGLVFYLIWKKERPKTAKVSLICTIVSFVLQIIFILLFILFVFGMLQVVANIG